MTIRLNLLAVLLLACIAQEAGPLSSYKVKVLDLNFHIVDLHTRIEDLGVKKTANVRHREGINRPKQRSRQAFQAGE
jgi:hypothetical protein